MGNPTYEQEQEIIKLYLSGKGQSYCSKQVLGQSSGYWTKKTLEKYHIPIRDHKTANILQNKARAKHKKEDFFSIQSSDMAWLMGFIASDGTIRKDCNGIKISLALKDKEILEKIKEVLELETEVKEFQTSNGYDACTLAWTCEQHKKDLAKYNIVPAKTFILTPPIGLNEKYYIDYIRGYFDGDGSINLIKNSNGRGNGNIRWQVCSATKEIIEFIVDTLYTQYNIPKVAIMSDDSKNRQNTLYYCQYSSTASREIYKILYTENSLYLKRKKDKFEEVLSLIKPLK